MSYRAIKRLLGETSLGRKFLFLFGIFTVLLITSSFLIYAWQTDRLAYQQLETTSRLLVDPVVAQQILTVCHLKEATNEEQMREEALRQYPGRWGMHSIEPPPSYLARFIRPKATDPEKKPSEPSDYQQLKEFLENEDKLEANQLLLSQGQNYYYAAIRASPACIECHSQVPANKGIKEGDLIAVVRISVPTATIENEIHINRAILLTLAFGVTVAIMVGSHLIVRYLVVKPVKHLKEVSDAISAGELNVRSEIQTADEFEDLSYAFNRMLRSLVSVQDRLRKVNADLDRKVDELAQANMALYESNRLKSDFLATMSHELRTPLNSILGFSEVLLSSDQLSDKQQRWVRNIQSSGDRLLNLINDILDLAKIEAGKMQVRLAEFSVYDVCDGLLAMFRPLAEKKNIELRGQLESGIPLMRQDVVKVQQILSNLLSNAIKFTPEGGRVLLQAESGPQCVVLKVSDTGVGIAADEQELVFEKFRQGGNPLTREHAGTGLGLSIVRELANLLAGEVTLQSELGRGSTFMVRLPLHLSKEPRLEFDVAHQGIDLTKAQRVESRVYRGPSSVSQPAGTSKNEAAGPSGPAA
jgi:signal transduction histidine kinase